MRGLMFGKSMKPKMGIINFVRGEHPNIVCVGDIVCFTRPKKPGKIIHRVIDIDTSGKLYIKGDNAPEIDCIPFSNVIAKITSFRKLL